MKQKIFVRLIGGYGNQLFIYAFGKSLAKQTGRELILDDVSGFGNPSDEYKSVFALDGLNIDVKIISNTIFKYFIANKYFWYIANKIGVSYVEPSQKKYNNILPSNKLFFQGYWQSYLYFDNYKKLLKKQITPTKVLHKNLSKYKKTILKSKNSIAIGMRFYEETYNSRNKYIIKDQSYYFKAIKFVEKKVKNPKYFIFSTHINKAKQIINNCNIRDAIFINPIKSKKNAKYDLYLMSLCKNFIISNGTFYWWAAYLGESQHSIIIAPKNSFINADALPDHWTKI
tara:strand:- start:233 stop:1087 length:855 start_codon:yes stop_codon:yes gene_type:complete